MLYDDGAEVILTATRDGLSKDSDNAKDWNDGQPTEASDKQAVSYRALFIAGPSDKGQELVKKVNGVLDQMRKDGSYAKLYEKWFGFAPKESDM